MRKLVFEKSEYPTIGVELELGLVDSQSMELTSRINDLLFRLPPDIKERVKPELMQCCVEINTSICHDVKAVDTELTRLAHAVQSVADGLGIRLWWGATHPFSMWQDQRVTPSERYEDLVMLLQEMARRLITFGLHVHIGVDSGDKAVMICDRIMQHLPTLLALTCSSPYWEGRDTGLFSYRSKIMEGLPTAGLPSLMRNWSEYTWLINHLVDTGFINTIREIWWDVRPHHRFGTVEVRICDMPGSLDDVLAVTALIQCLVKSLSDEIDEGTYQHDCHPMIVRQNKWRACRFGNQAPLVNSFTFEVETVGDIVRRMIRELEPTAHELGCWEYLQRNQQIADGEGWAYRQRRMQDQSCAREMVDQLTWNSRISGS
ncbi:MAG: YbdK family carboxylate-amine ligase [Pirellulaceae bacterium]